MLLTKNLQEQVLDYLNLFGSNLSSVAWAARSSYNNTINATPAQTVFGRDMMFNLTTLVNWKELSLKKQQLVDKANLRENKKRIDYDYQVHDLVTRQCPPQTAIKILGGWEEGPSHAPKNKKLK